MFLVCLDLRRACAGVCAVLLVSLSVVSAPRAAAPADVGFSSKRLDAGAEFALAWPDPVDVEVQSDRREVLLRFSRPLGDVPVASLVKEFPDLVQDVRYGFDSVLVRSTRDVTFDVAVDRTGVVVRLVPLGKGASAGGPEAAGDDEFRLNQLRALALLQEGQTLEARKLLADLHAERPQDTDVIASLALAETELGRWRQAVRLYDEALQSRPGDSTLADARTRLLRQNGTFAKLQPTYIDYHNSDREVFAEASGKVLLPNGWAALGAVEGVYLDAGDVRRLNGSNEDFRGTRLRAELAGQYDWDDGEASTATLFINPDSAGAGLAHALGPLAARTTIKGAYHQPEWRYLEGVVNQGTRDLIEVEHQHTFSQWLQGGLSTSLNMYNVRDDDDVARSTAAGGFVRYAFRAARPLLTASYYLDTEWVNRDKRRQANGDTFSPLPIQSRAVNSIEIAASGQINEDLSYIVGAGYSADLVNDRHGPLVVAGLEYYLVKNVALNLNFRHALASARGEDGQYSEAGLYLVWYDL